MHLNQYVNYRFGTHARNGRTSYMVNRCHFFTQNCGQLTGFRLKENWPTGIIGNNFNFSGHRWFGKDYLI